MKVAIIHYWLVGMRGGEKVLESLLRIYPDADIYTHVADRSTLSSLLADATIHETFIARLPWARKKYRAYLPLMPLALEQLDLSAYDLVISCESGPAKGVITRPDALHICYCHSPMRYAWDMYHDYTGRAGFLKRTIMAVLLHYIRIWDYASAARVDHFIANSRYVASRIRKFYRRESMVINPPVDFERFQISPEIGDYYLCLGQLVSYKRADLAIEAFNRSGRRLIVVGEGEQYEVLSRLAGPNVEMKGKVPFAEIVRLYAQCKALIFPGIEDFGIVPLEAMASGRPVIAYGKGGVLDSVIPGKTGLFFQEQSSEALNVAIADYESKEATFDSEIIRQHAHDFSKEIFEKRIKETIALLRIGHA
jgi:glycosyltransferase involved in cell wall biosynthesis